jgi:transposase
VSTRPNGITCTTYTRGLLERICAADTIGWISRNRCLARDFDRHRRIAAAFVQMAMIRIMLRRLAAKTSA